MKQDIITALNGLGTAQKQTIDELFAFKLTNQLDPPVDWNTLNQAGKFDYVAEYIIDSFVNDMKNIKQRKLRSEQGDINIDRVDYI